MKSKVSADGRHLSINVRVCVTFFHFSSVSHSYKTMLHGTSGIFVFMFSDILSYFPLHILYKDNTCSLDGLF